MALSTEYYTAPSGEMTLGIAPLLSQLAASQNGGGINLQSLLAQLGQGATTPSVGTTVGTPVGGGNRGTGGGAALGNVGGAGQLGAEAAAGNTAVNPSLSSAARLGLAIATGGTEAPLDMLGGLAASQLLGGLGLGDLSIGGISLGNPFNVPGPSLNEGDLSSAIGAAIAKLGPNPSQVAVATAISDTIAQARAAAAGQSTTMGTAPTGNLVTGAGTPAPGAIAAGNAGGNVGAGTSAGSTGNLSTGAGTPNPGGINAAGGSGAGGGSQGGGSSGGGAGSGAAGQGGGQAGAGTGGPGNASGQGGREY